MELSIQNVTKTYSNKVKAINDISLDIQPGMFGLLGPNGAGKSSLMRTVATLQEPDSGQVLFEGMNILHNRHEFRKLLGFLPQEFGVYPKDSAYSLLNYFAILKGIGSKKDRAFIIDKVLEITNLTDAKNQRVSTFSGGMRQRFGIAQLLLNDPKVIIVDEPTAGLDPAERSRFLNVLRSIGTDNIVIFSTHLVEDVRELCNDMAILNKGSLLVQTNPKKALHSLEGSIWETSLSQQKLQQLDHSHTVLSDRYNDENQLVNRIYSNTPLTEFTSVNAKLEDYYYLSLDKS